MAITIVEVERIDSIDCLENGIIQVRKGRYYEKTKTETVPVTNINETQTPAVDEDGNPVYRKVPVLDEAGNPTSNQDGTPVLQNALDEDGNPIQDIIIDYETIETGETKEETEVTLELIENWRTTLAVHDEDTAEEVLGEKKSIALAHWASLPVPEEPSDPVVE